MRHAFLTSLVVSSVLFSLTLTSSAKSATEEARSASFHIVSR